MDIQKYFENNTFTLNLYKRFRSFCYFSTVHPFVAVGKWMRKNKIMNNYKYLMKFQDCHKDERCFIVATGPSLTIEDVNLLKNEHTFGVNGLCLWFDKYDIKTDYFVISDSRAYEKLYPNLSEIKDEMVFMPQYILKKYKPEKKYSFFPVDKSNGYRSDVQKGKYSRDINVTSYNSNTVAIHAIQIAAFMGFKEIYLLGVDCNYNKDASKWYSIDHGIRDRNNETAGLRMINDFEVLKKFSDKWGVKVFNAARGGMLEVFERVDLDDIINK